ncbi:adenylate/guanylate cyclase domain-containing protein [Candidatus Nitrosocosmicus agrestis]|uniref:adenylate/guanylate cyclase domain-containing protein n=1 Tax=Candidatus Nitrosocosmicus agrestis TaxID=2563600 RepID=UPI0013312B3B|nr:adenylate/guanylate cyclase domain-containing protein [Candidatus Nitrosocosmicus sp. SS]KAF0869988.1 adenylate/guanylate cyclase domain-containing protein [Candidatus Nitrosocosmicus sp. SS]MDR4492624.1 adenylate/guanylate cyclase domain-containing protein [Candidatus Nitrosocosmicus sp.]
MQLPNQEDDDSTFLKGIQQRVALSIENNGLFIDLSTDSCRKFLQRKVNSNANIVVMYVDIAGSTQMSRDISPANLSLIIQIFSQEISLAVVKFGGYVLKFVGDAVIALFPSDFNPNQAIQHSLECATHIQETITKGVNPIFRQHSLGEIAIKIGIEYGSALVILYGKNINHAHIDLIGFSISIAAKITSVAYPNEIVVGENAYNNIDSSLKKSLVTLYDNNSKWTSTMKFNNNLSYRIYKYTKEQNKKNN